MNRKGRGRPLDPRQVPRPGTLAFLHRAFRGCECTSREGPEGDSQKLGELSSSACGLLGTGIAIGAALGGAGLVPAITVSAAQITGGMDVAMELELESEDSSVVSIDVAEKEELKSEEQLPAEMVLEETQEDMLIEDGEVPPEIVAASLSLSASESTLASEAASLAESAAVSTSLLSSETVSESLLASENAARAAVDAVQSQEAMEETSAAEYEEEEEYEEFVEEQDFWDAPTELLENLFDELIETNEEDVEEVSSVSDSSSESESASLAASAAAWEKQSMFTSIAVAASELQEEGLQNAVRLESQYGLQDFTALANAMAHENDSVRKSLNATIQQSEGDSEQMASILGLGSEKEDAFTSESLRAADRLAEIQGMAKAFSTFVQESEGGAMSPSELM